MADLENWLLQTSVEHQNKPHILTLTTTLLSWEPSHSGHNACVDLREVIGVTPIKIPPKTSTLKLKKAHKVSEHAPVCYEMQPLGPLGFSVYVATRCGNHKYRYRQVSFQCKDSQLCQQWVNAIKEALRLPAFRRPKHLVVFVNPFSGKNKAVKIYREKVLPLLELADIKVQKIETQRQNHARDLVRFTLDLKEIDGLVCVGGDGMFAEVLNGLLDRTNSDNQVVQTESHKPVTPDIRIGIIPAGSTNTIVYTTTGVSDPVTSTLHIILGDSLGIDVNSVNVDDQFTRYSVTMLGYGYMGDLLKDSEGKRWMGPKRYDFSGTKALVANNAYYGEVRFRLSSNTDSHPTDQVKCYQGCETCNMAREESSASLEDLEESTDSVDSCWQTVRGKFVAVNSVTMSCSCDLSPPGMSPYCHLGDGCTDLILVSDCSRIDFLRFLLHTAQGKERHNLDYIQMFRVKEFTFRPLNEESDLDSLVESGHTSESNRHKLRRQTSRTSVWNCDGEVIHYPKISVRVHCQLVSLFARGVEDPNNSYDDVKCTCCHPSFERL